MNQLVVDTGAVRAHARTVDGIAGSLQEAVDASATVAIPDDSFGLLCSFLVPGALLVQSLGAELVQAGSTAMDGIVLALDASATTYDAIDSAVHTGLRMIEKVLP
ncbi:type VII secretion target [Cellulomonas soli]|uniref:ESX-1 secretion-associated protein n=1 Tax=Cellulomonas soli TaxID=931535 RepID=A0A512PEB3_9CELL|nr:type VII secretion target [Cellulomonas soli]NYI58963.1 hypothetical protein [Cellulomonas soli]GEP69544.1 hypothetical protein CSO01_22590 [Cellulomonas soli]